MESFNQLSNFVWGPMPIEKDTNVCQQGLYMDTAGGAQLQILMQVSTPIIIVSYLQYLLSSL